MSTDIEPRYFEAMARAQAAAALAIAGAMLREGTQTATVGTGDPGRRLVIEVTLQHFDEDDNEWWPER